MSARPENASPSAASTSTARPPSSAVARCASSSRSSVPNSSKRVRPRSSSPATKLCADSIRPALMSASFASQQDADDQPDAGGDAERGVRMLAHPRLELVARAGEALADFLHALAVGARRDHLLGGGDHVAQLLHQLV